MFLFFVSEFEGTLLMIILHFICNTIESFDFHFYMCRYVVSMWDTSGFE